jgi:MFS family permease
MELITLQWLVLEMTDSPARVALVGACRMAPMFFFGLLAGNVADRFPKPRVILAGQLVGLSVVSIILLLLLTDQIVLWQIYLGILVTGTAKVIDFAARRAYFSELFEGSKLTNAVALDSVASMGIGSTVGPLLGGGLIAIWGFTGTYSVIFLSSLVATALVIAAQSLPTQTIKEKSHTSISTTSSPVRDIWQNRPLWAVLAVTIVMNFFCMPYQQMVPIIARDTLGVGSALYGLLASSSGLGVLTGTLLIAGHTINRRGTTFSVGATLMLVAVFLFAFSPSYSLSILLLLLAGLANAGFVVMQPLLVLHSVPSALRGRAMGALALSIGISPLGVLTIGILAESYGATFAIAIMAGAGFVLLNVLRAVFRTLRDPNAYI